MYFLKIIIVRLKMVIMLTIVIFLYSTVDLSAQKEANNYNVIKLFLNNDEIDSEKLTWEDRSLLDKIDFIIDLPFEYLRKVTIPRK